MAFARVVSVLPLVLAIAGTACTRDMGRVSQVRMHRVEPGEVDKDVLAGFCCGKASPIRVDFVSDMDYAHLIKHGVHLSIRYGWCPIDEHHHLSSTGLFEASGRVEGTTVMTPVGGTRRRPLYAYHGYLPASSLPRRYTEPGESDGAYDLRKAKGDFCFAVGGGAMWWGQHGQSTSGVVPKAAILEALGP
ncbi:hypothetical protein [Luteibacter sp. CQ10]|uniref:hypothetical protein n=1 Tax=Luteibacter sp. CQ10 TaxID=2805821 RepID=UPI0034A50BF5